MVPEGLERYLAVVIQALNQCSASAESFAGMFVGRAVRQGDRTFEGFQTARWMPAGAGGHAWEARSDSGQTIARIRLHHKEWNFEFDAPTEQHLSDERG